MEQFFLFSVAAVETGVAEITNLPVKIDSKEIPGVARLMQRIGYLAGDRLDRACERHRVTLLNRYFQIKSMNPAAKWYFESQELYKILCGDAAEAGFILQTVEKNQSLYVAGDQSDRVYFVKKGRVKIYNYSESKTEVVRAILSAGEIFGELALSGEDRRSDFALAMDKNTTVYYCTLEEMLGIMERRPEVSLRIVKLIGLRMLKMERKVELVTVNDARQRVIEFLRDAAEWKGKKVGTETLIETPLTHHDLAKLVGLSRQMLTMLLNDLKRENVIYFDRKRILIRDISHFH